MSCTCQVKDRDSEKPCPVCGDEPRLGPAAQERIAMERERLAGLMADLKASSAPERSTR